MLLLSNIISLFRHGLCTETPIPKVDESRQLIMNTINLLVKYQVVTLNANQATGDNITYPGLQSFDISSHLVLNNVTRSRTKIVFGNEALKR